MSRLFAQATTAPNSGASNANDFQPLTRNPQNPANTQQQQGNLQNPGTQEVLGRSDLKITVPTTTPAQVTAPTATPQPAGTNWFAVLVVVVVICSGIGYFISKQHKKRRRRAIPSVAAEPQEVLLVPAEELPPKEEDTKPAKPVGTAAPAKKKPKKKSKSKRKHK